MLARIVNSAFSSTQATVYGQAESSVGPNYFIIHNETYGSVSSVNAVGFSYVTIENNSAPVTVAGGGASGTVQNVLAGSGGLNFTASTGSAFLIASGSKSFVSLQGSGHNAATMRPQCGHNAAIFGSGNNTVSVGGGYNYVEFAGGSSTVTTVVGRRMF